MNNLSKNISYQSLYQILTIITPLITAPYLARVLGANQLGVFSYSSSVVAYFTMFAMLGTVNYGTKVIAECYRDRSKLSQVFMSVYVFQLLTCIITFICYIVFVTFMNINNKLIFYIQGLSIVACFFNVNWLLYGLEEFGIITTRNIVIKILEVSAILFLVKTDSDLVLYILIMTMGTCVSNAIAFCILRKNNIKIEKVSWQNIKVHIIPNLKLFLPLLAISVYHIMDKTMLGMFSTYTECGYYYNSDKLINIPLCLITGMGIVMLPRVSKLISNGQKHEVTNLLNLTLELVISVGVAVSVGIASISKEFIPFFFGNGYDKCIILTYLFAPVLVIKGIVSTIRMQYLIPYGREKEFLYSVCVGAMANLFLNLILIPQYASLGAVIGTLGAEAIACFFQVYKLRTEIRITKILTSSIIYFVFGILLYVTVRSIALIDLQVIIKLLIQVIAGSLVYLGLVLCFWYYNKRPYFNFLFSRYLK